MSWKHLALEGIPWKMRFSHEGGNLLRRGTIGTGEFDGWAGWFPGTLDAVNQSLECVCPCRSFRTFPATESNDENISSPFFQKSLIDFGSKYNRYFCKISIFDIISAIFLIISLLNISTSDTLRLNISPFNSLRIFFPSSKFVGLLFFSLVQYKIYLSIRSQNF